MPGTLDVQRWPCQACLGSASPLPPGVTSRQRPQTFRELVADLYVHSVRFRGLARILALLGGGVGAATLWRDVPAVAPGREPPAGAAADLGRGGRDLGCPSAAPSGPWPWSWARRGNGWTCA